MGKYPDSQENMCWKIWITHGQIIKHVLNRIDYTWANVQIGRDMWWKRWIIHGKMSKKTRICGKKDGLYMGNYQNRQRYVLKNHGVHKANNQIGKDMCWKNGLPYQIGNAMCWKAWITNWKIIKETKICVIKIGQVKQIICIQFPWFYSFVHFEINVNLLQFWNSFLWQVKCKII